MRTQTCHNGGKHPHWGETFTFNDCGDQNLRVEIWDFDTIGNDQFIGAGSLNLMAAMSGGSNSGTINVIQFGSTCSLTVETLAEFAYQPNSMADS